MFIIQPITDYENHVPLFTSGSIFEWIWYRSSFLRIVCGRSSFHITRITFHITHLSLKCVTGLEQNRVLKILDRVYWKVVMVRGKGVERNVLVKSKKWKLRKSLNTAASKSHQRGRMTSMDQWWKLFFSSVVHMNYSLTQMTRFRSSNFPQSIGMKDQFPYRL